MTQKILRTALTIFMTLAFTTGAFAFTYTATEVINNFAFNAAKILSDKSGDFFFSPYSILSAFGMAYTGASNTTATEIEEVLGFSRENQTSFGDLIRDIEKSKFVTSANRVWLRDGLNLKQAYKDDTALYYGSTLKELNFMEQPEEARKTINAWISDKTNGKIKDLLGEMNPDTQMILTNAVYFNAEWKDKFNKKSTEPKKFYIDNNNETNVSMMRAHREYMFGEFDGFKIIRLPYKGYRLSMVAVLPPKEQDSKLDTIDAKTFTRWLESLDEYEVDLWLPKFKAEKRYAMKDLFKELGIKLAFSDFANFSGITEDEKLKIDDVIHKTFIDVDEDKTEAAAATAITMMRATAMPVTKRKPKAEFHADHPFMYFIMDNYTGTILFMGRQTFAKY